jgi:hypothetical protein
MLLLISFSSCHNEYIPAPEPAIGTGFGGHILYQKLIPALKGANQFISLKGSGHSNIVELSYLLIENSHIVIRDDNENPVYIKNGKFRISGAGKIAMYGIYEETGAYKEKSFSSELEFTVLGGEVYFKGTSGNFTGKLETSLDDPETLNLNFNGRISGIE